MAQVDFNPPEQTLEQRRDELLEATRQPEPENIPAYINWQQEQAVAREKARQIDEYLRARNDPEVEVPEEYHRYIKALASPQSTPAIKAQDGQLVIDVVTGVERNVPAGQLKDLGATDDDINQAGQYIKQAAALKKLSSYRTEGDKYDIATAIQQGKEEAVREAGFDDPDIKEARKQAQAQTIGTGMGARPPLTESLQPPREGVGKSEASLPVAIWRYLTPWVEESNETAATYLKKRFTVRGPGESQEDLRAQYQANISAPTWSKLLFGNDIFYDAKNDKYYQLVQGEAPPFAPNPLGTPVARGIASALPKTMTRVKVANWDEIVADIAKARKEVRDKAFWDELQKAIKRGEIKNAGDAAKWKPPVKKWTGPLPQEWKGKLTPAEEAAKAKQLEKFKKSQATYKTISKAQQGKIDQAGVKKVAQAISTNLYIASMAQPTYRVSASEYVQTMGRMTPEQAAKRLEEFDARVEAISQTRTLTKAQVKALTEFQTAVRAAVETQAATQTETQVATRVATRAVHQTKMRPTTKPATKTRIPSKTPPPPKIPRVPGPPKPPPPKTPPPPKVPKKKLGQGTSDQERRDYIKTAGGAIAWPQGELSGQKVWHVVTKPYSPSDHLVVVGKPPEGAEVKPGPGEAYRSILQLYGTGPGKGAKFEGGIADPVISGSGKNVTIAFVPDKPARKRGRRHYRITETELGQGVVETRHGGNVTRHLKLT